MATIGTEATTPTSAVSITSTSPIPNCSSGTPFSFSFNAVGGVTPYTWSLFSGSLQPGLSLASSGMLTGTCSNSSGTVSFTVQVCDSEALPACITGPFQQTAQSGAQALAVCDSSSSPTCPNPPSTGITGTFYQYNFSAIGGAAPYSWTVVSGTIPPGVALGSLGSFAGFPTAAGTYTFTVKVTDSATPTPQTATAPFTVVITGANGAPQIAAEPTTWVTGHMGGVDTSSGLPCSQSSTSCTWSLPKTCNAANHCIHEQLGFGSNDHPATLAGLYAAGCDWTTTLTTTAAQQSWYLWTEVANGSALLGAELPGSGIVYGAPVKQAGVISLQCAGAATNTPQGVWSVAGSASAGVYTAASCSFSDVSAVINGPTHTAVNGDVINIPAGSCTWGNNSGSTVGNLAVSVCIDIKGAGASATILSDNVKKDGNANSSLITFNVACPSNVAIVENLQIVGMASDLSINSKGHISFYGSGQGFRVHHLTVNTPQTQLVFGNWISPGVLDHITVNNCGGGASGSVENGGLNLKADAWGGGGENYGDGSWFASDANMPASAVYWETSTFNCVGQATVSEVGDSTAGSRMVFRFNTINNANTTSHGTDTGGRERGQRWFESYKNIYNFYQNGAGGSQSPAWAAWYRSGAGAFWGNTLTSFPTYLNNAISVANCRDDTGNTGCLSGSGTPVPWGHCDKTKVYDQDVGTHGYRCIDQPGSGQGIDYGGASTPPNSWAGNDNLPIYVFLNTGNGSEFDTTTNNAGTSYSNVTQNQDYYVYQTSGCAGTQTTGVCSGATIASAAASCTAGVGFWATSEGTWNQSGSGGQGRLYKCGAGNTWSLYYTPYTYPHPLTAGSPSSGGLQLGEVMIQATTGATALLTFVPTSTPGPMQLDSITQGTPDASHTWTGQTTGATFVPSAAPVANGFFRLTGQCSPGAGSGSPLTPGYPIGSADTPCNNLPDQPPCFHSILNSSLVNNTNCTNDLPAMFSIVLNASGSAPVVIEQDGWNTSLSGFEVSIMPGSNQSMRAEVCALYPTSNPGALNCNAGTTPVLVQMTCGDCVEDHIWAHGWDPGDGAPTWAPTMSQQQVAITNGYPVTPATSPAQYNCPSWAYFSTDPPNLTNPPVALSGPDLPYTNGCGDDVIFGYNVRPGGPYALEHISITKIHVTQSEAHALQLGVGQNATPGYPFPFGTFAGPGKIVDTVLRGSSEGIFVGTIYVGGLEVRRLRTEEDPGYRFLSAGATNSPAWPTYGCNHGGSAASNRGCPFEWAGKKVIELKKADHVLFDGFIARFMWPDGQTGECLDATINVTSGGPNEAILDNNGVPMVRINDLRFQNGIMSDCAGGLFIRSRSGSQSNGGGTSLGMNRLLVYNLLWYDFDQNQLGGGNGGDVQTYGSTGNQTWKCPTVSRTSNKTTLMCQVIPITPTSLSDITSVSTGANNQTITATFLSDRQDPVNAGPGQNQSFVQFSCQGGGITCLGSGSQGLEFGSFISGGVDCRTLPCTTNSTGTFAPVCSPSGGVGDSSLSVGSACNNCDVGGASACPAFGATAVGQPSPFTAQQVCHGTGSGAGPPPGCGPANLTFPSLAFSTFNISPSDVVIVANCTDASLNTPAEPIVPNVYADSSQLPSGLTLVYPQVGSNVSYTNETCQAINQPGWQRNFITNHVTMVTGGKARYTMTPFGYNTQMVQNQIINSLYYFGSIGTGFVCTSGACNNKEANQGAYKTFDQASNQIHHNAFILPTTARAALYTGVGVSGTNICSAGTIPGGYNCAPPTMTCAGSTQGWTGAANTSDPACAGLVGFMSGNAFPSTDCTLSLASCPLVAPPWGSFDYHNLALCEGCNGPGVPNVMKYMGTDGFQLGACIGGIACADITLSNTMTSIDQALQRTKYVCTGACGTGPWPD